MYQRLVKTGVESSMRVLFDYFNTASQLHISITKEWIEQQVLKFFISANISFRQVDNKYFQELISKIQVNDSIANSSSRKVIQARLSKETKVAKTDLKVILSQN